MLSLSQLIHDAQGGDAAAVEQLMERFRSTIRYECDHFGLHEHADLSVSDLTQEVLLQVWVKLPQFKGSDDEEHTGRAFVVWLRKNARTALSNLYRNRTAQKRMPQQPIESYRDDGQVQDRKRDEPPQASSIVRHQEDAERLNQAIEECLDERTRLIVRSYIVEGKTFKEIADQLSLTYHQVRHAFENACARLGRWLD
jgi:RNA polymerase sigma factor (sigma-70 family)